MELPTVEERSSPIPEFLSGGGELGKRIREYDWASTSLGPVDTWPQSLRTVISICLNSNFPIAIYWGKDLTLIYNDAWSSIPGNKHPWALGKTAKEVWPDIWDAIESQFEKAFTGLPGGSKDALLPMHRHGYTEECYFDFTFTPVYGEAGKVEGVFNAVIETTYRVISERRTAFLKDLAINITDVHSQKELFTETINFIQSFSRDISFALLFTITNNSFELEASTLPEEQSIILRNKLPLAEITDAGKFLCFNDFGSFLPEPLYNYWPEEISEACAVPITDVNGNPLAFLLCGLSARRHFDEEYKIFLETVGSTIATVYQSIISLEEQRKKAEALAEIDRAKTIFFSNISHEFRTPLTLLLGPIEDALNDPNTIPENKLRMDVAYRNALRMLKLVNTLLEFSRIEAGRAEGRFMKVDIGKLTQDLASTFRSAIEKAGMELVFYCNEIKDEVYVDVDMWEKIVLNLVSNAFKYSDEGRISVQVKQVGKNIQLSVSDTGVGIPQDQLEKVFDRFHRIENIRGRSQEGTGIGLAMVKELVRLHHGSVHVESEAGRGSTFIISIPAGKDHLPADKIVENNSAFSTSGFSNAFVQEAMKWIPNEKSIPGEMIDESIANAQDSFSKEQKPKVVLADDNADMRDYVYRLLSSQFEVINAVDGEDAFKKILQHKPQLLLTDIMMPKLDGFGLLKKIRSEIETRSIPVIFLSARAGEEAKVEGLDAGADDYLVKPFSARELIAKVSSQIRVNELRDKALHDIYNMFDEVPFAVAVLMGESLKIEFINKYNLDIWRKKKDEVIGKPLFEVFPGNRLGAEPLHKNIYETGERFFSKEIPIELWVNDKPVMRYFNAIIDPLRDERGEIIGQIATSIDVTDFVVARKKIEESEAGFRQLANAMPQLVWVAEPGGEVVYYNDRIIEFAGAEKKEDEKWKWDGMVHKDDVKATGDAWKKAVKNGTIYQAEHRIQMKDGSYRWFLSRAYPQKDENGNLIKWFGTATDIHSAKKYSAILEEEVKKRTQELQQMNVSLQQSNHELQQFAHVASHDLREPLRKIKTFSGRLTGDHHSNLSDKAKVYLDKINSAADRMNIMIEGVLNYSMLNASYQKIAPVDLNETIHHIETDLEVLIAQKSAKIKYGKLPVIDGASVLLYQLFYNLINNSLKFSKPHVDTLIEITSANFENGGKEFAEIKLKDNGIGFEQEFAEKIFETFLRLNSKDQYEGTGLGLSLCKRIAERHGGWIKATGETGTGAIFEITLPLKQEENII